MMSSIPNKPIKVAFICDDLMIGGWTSLISMLPKFSPEKIDPILICLFGTGPNSIPLKEHGIPVYNFDFRKHNLLFKLYKLAGFLKNEKIDIVHTQLHLSHLIGQTSALLAGCCKRVIQVHSMETPPSGIIGIWKKFLIRKSHGVIAVSHAAAKTFSTIYDYNDKQIITIHNGIDIERFRNRLNDSSLSKEDIGITADCFSVFTVANLKPQKGLHTLIDAAAILKDTSHQFFLVGDGNEQSALKKYAETKGVSKQFHFLGTRQDVPELLAIADIFVLPSIKEAFGISLLEAFSAGIPSIASNVGGIPEIAEDKTDAVLVTPNEPRELAKAIQTLREDAVFRQKLSDSAKRKSEKFSIEKMTDAYTEFYQQLSSDEQIS